MAAAIAKLWSKQFRDTDTNFCGCGEPKRASHQRCKKCRQKASRNAHLEKIQSKDRIRKATSGPVVTPVMSEAEIKAHVESYVRCAEKPLLLPLSVAYQGQHGPWGLGRRVFADNRGHGDSSWRLSAELFATRLEAALAPEKLTNPEKIRAQVAVAQIEEEI